MPRHTPGWSFDNQWENSKKRGQAKAARGEGPWADDAYLRGISNERLRDAEARAEATQGKKSCASASAFLLGTLGGVAWFLSETVGRAL